MGITFLAAGTSVPDCMASLIVARQGIHKNRQKAPSKGGGVVEMTVIAMDEASQRPDDCWIIVFFFLPPLPFCPCGVAVKECGVAERRQLDEISSLILSSVFILSLVIKYLNSAVCLSLATAALQSSILCFVAAGASPLWLWDVNPTHSSTDLACTILPTPPRHPSAQLPVSHSLFVSLLCACTFLFQWFPLFLLLYNSISVFLFRNGRHGGI